MNSLVILASSFGIGIIYASFFEWLLHKYLMHRPLWFVKYPYQAHAVTHHGIFGSGKNYHLLEGGHAEKVTMAWWNAPVLLMINSPVGLLGAYLVGSWWVLPGVLGALLVYYGAYEYLHWCMHVPSKRWFQTTRAFSWIDRHHRLHHLSPGKNLNVVLPIADFILRTRLARAPQ